ncbi:MAG: 6-hydroxymethylpterin diphosphokinase MptE-like protein [bacterium]
MTDPSEINMLKLTAYQKNISALQEKSPEFSLWLKSQPNQRQVELINTLAGRLDLRLQTEDGKTVVLYNHDDPVQLTRDDLENREFLKESVTFLFGLGLGYKVQQVLEKMENGHLLFIVEQDPQIIRLALSLHDFSDAVRQERLIFCIPEEEQVRRKINQQGPRLLDGKISLELEDFAPKISPLYSVLFKSSQRFCNTLFLSYNTFVALSDTFIVNELKNLPKIVLGHSTHGFCMSEDADGQFSHIPAILVATGPSLQKNIHLLAKARGKAVIIAVGQALRVLLAYGITPDIICSIDFGKPNYHDLEDVILDATMPLVIDSRVYPRIPFEYQGDLVIPVSYDDILFQAKGNYREKVNRGKTVAQLCLNLALAMGADPIVFTGQDLALGATSHISGANADTSVVLQGNSIVRRSAKGEVVNEAYWVDGIYGGKVLTTKVLMGYLEDFENTIKNSPDRHFIDATEGGARIKGTEVMTLQEALDQYCREEYDIPRLIRQALTPLDPDIEILTGDLDAVSLLVHKILRINKKLEKPIRLMRRLLPYADGESPSQSPDKKEGLEQEASKQEGEEEALNEQKALNKGRLDRDTFSESRKKQFEELSQNVHRGFRQISRAINSHRIIRSSLGKVRHALMQRQNRYEDDAPFSEKARVTLNRYELAHSGFGAVVSRVKDALDETLSQLKRYRRLKRRKNEAEGRMSDEARADFHFQMGLCLKRMGYLKRAIPEFEQAKFAGSPCGTMSPADSRGKKEEVLRELVEIYLTLEQFDQAQACLKELQSGSPDPQGDAGFRTGKMQDKIQASRKKCLEKYLNKACERSRGGDFVNAILYSRKVLAIDPDEGSCSSAQARDILKNSLEQCRQKITSTQEDIRQLKEEGERKKELALQLAEARKLIQSNDFDKAVQAYQEIMATQKDHPEVHFGLSRAYQGQKDWESALKELRWLAERYPHKAQVHVDIGDTYLSISGTDCQEASSTIADAFLAYKKAIETDKSFVHLYLKMANICFRSGKIEDAIVHYEDYLNLNPADYHSLVKLGDCYLLMGARDAAKIGYQAALRIQPNYLPAVERITRLSL